MPARYSVSGVVAVPAAAGTYAAGGDLMLHGAAYNALTGHDTVGIDTVTVLLQSALPAGAVVELWLMNPLAYDFTNIANFFLAQTAIINAVGQVTIALASWPAARIRIKSGGTSGNVTISAVGSNFSAADAFAAATLLAGTSALAALLQNGPGMPGIAGTCHPNAASAGATWPLANRACGARVVIPKTGVLHDLSIYPTVASGNIDIGIYDTGDASPGNYTRLYSRGAVACPTAGQWNVIGDPALPVTAGQQLVFMLSCDNVTAAVLRQGTGNANTLPAGFMPCPGGALPKLTDFAATSHPLPASIAEVNMLSTGGYNPVIIGRIV